MTIKERIQARLVLCAVAQKYGQPVEQVRQEMQTAIDAAWDQAWQPGNLQAQVEWQRWFPGGRKPSLEQFLITMGQQLRSP